MFYEKLLKLCEANNISLTFLLTEQLKMSSGNITKWKNGNVPKSDTINKIATYFNVSTDYLLGNKKKNTPPSALDSEVLKWADKLRKLTPEQQKAIEAIVDSFQSNQ